MCVVDMTVGVHTMLVCVNTCMCVCVCVGYGALCVHRGGGMEVCVCF